jgi:hypothetical protein
LTRLLTHKRTDRVHLISEPRHLPVHSFQTLLADLATVAKNRIQPKLSDAQPFDMITRPTVLQQRALALLGVTL